MKSALPRPHRARKATMPATPYGSRSSRAQHQAARRRAPTRSSPPASPGSSSAVEDPDPACAGQGSPRLRAAGIDVEVGVEADAVADPAGAVPEAPPHRPPVGRAQAGRLPRRPHRRARRHEPVDHRSRRHVPTPTGCGPRATPSLVGAGTVRADDPSLTVRHVDGPRPAAGRPRPGAGRRQGPPVPRARRRRSATCSTSSAAAGVLQLLVEGGADRRPRLPRGRPGRPLRDLPRAGAVRRRRRPRRCSPVRGAATIDDVWRGRSGRSTAGRRPRDRARGVA